MDFEEKTRELLRLNDAATERIQVLEQALSGIMVMVDKALEPGPDQYHPDYLTEIWGVARRALVEQKFNPSQV